jgi:hypothetical protein
MTRTLRPLARGLFRLIDNILCVAVGLALGYVLLVVGAKVVEVFGG